MCLGSIRRPFSVLSARSLGLSTAHERRIRMFIGPVYREEP
jgi:hypothetical protein